MHSVIVMHRVLPKRDHCYPIDDAHGDDDDAHGDDRVQLCKISVDVT